MLTRIADIVVLLPGHRLTRYYHEEAQTEFNLFLVRNESKDSRREIKSRADRHDPVLNVLTVVLAFDKDRSRVRRFYRARSIKTSEFTRL